MVEQAFVVRQVETAMREWGGAGGSGMGELVSLLHLQSALWPCISTADQYSKKHKCYLVADGG